VESPVPAAWDVLRVDFVVVGVVEEAVSSSTGAGFSGSSAPGEVSSIQRTTLPSE
jgi:hypothetical protein